MQDNFTLLKTQSRRFSKTDLALYTVGLLIVCGLIILLGFLAKNTHFSVFPISLVVGLSYSIFGFFRSLVLRRVNLTSLKLDRDLKILQISDLHSNSKKRALEIIKIVKQVQPDLICFTGDTWEKCDPCPERHLGVQLLVTSLAHDFPTYIVSGNHDDTIILPGFLSKVLPKGELDFEFSARKNGEILDEINLFGVSMENDGETVFATNSDKLNIALAHFPQTAEKLLQNNPKLDLVLAGDTHGGQVRLPFLGAVFCYGLTFFPELKPKHRYLVRGLADPCRKIRLSLRKTYSLDNRQLFYTCSGAGFSGLPLRTFCPAQVSLICIKSAKIKSDA